MTAPSEPPVSAPPGPAPLSQRARLWVANAVVLPVIIWVGLRWQLRAQREAPGVQWLTVLEPVPDPDALLRALLAWGVGLLLTALALRWAWAVWAKPGTRVRRIALWTLLVLWVLVWLGGSAAAWRTQANALGLHSPRTVELELVGLQQLEPSARSEGGARIFVVWPEQGGLYRAIVPEPSAELLAKPPRLRLELAQGRYSGWFLTGWAVPTDGPPAPAGSPASTP